MLAGEDDRKRPFQLRLQHGQLVRLRVALVVKGDLADVRQAAQRGQILHDLDAGVVHARVADEFIRRGLFNQRHARAADDGINALKRFRRRHDARNKARVDGVDEHALVALHDQRAVFADKEHIVGICVEITAQGGILPPAGDAEEHALFLQLGDDLGQLGGQALGAVQQGAVHIAGNEFYHIVFLSDGARGAHRAGARRAGLASSLRMA